MRRRTVGSLRFCLIIFFVIATGTAGYGFQEMADASQPLLMDAPSAAVGFRQVNPAVVVRQRAVHVDWRLFEGAVPDSLYLNLFNDRHYTAALSRIESGPEGGLAWIGRIAGQPDSSVTLVVDGRQASGIFRIAGQRFDLRVLNKDLHIVEEIAESNADAVAAFTDRMLRADIMGPEEREVLSLVNLERGKYTHLHPLSADDRLTTAARAHSQDMAANDYFSHTSLDGRSPGDRITAAGYDWNTYGENIAYGYRTPEAVMNAWMNSTGHRGNILDEDFCDLGVGYTPDGHYWTQDFGRLSGVDDCTTANGNPRAAFTAAPASGPAPLAVSLDANGSSDPDGDTLTFSWSLGDGQTASGASVSHTFVTAGIYNVVLNVGDGHGGTDTATRQITVTSPGNTAPRANADAYACDQDTALTVDAPGVLENDSDAENPGALAAVLVAAPEHGTLTLGGNGAFRYQPAQGFSGEDPFTYAASDGTFSSDPAVVTITVHVVPDDSEGDSSSGGGGGGGCFVQTAAGKR